MAIMCRHERGFKDIFRQHNEDVFACREDVHFEIHLDELAGM
jgi:hypothetical protein